ncbi:MAG: FAD-dependent oxidoreductase [bacterium]
MTQPPKSYDVAVLGGGITGLVAAYRLAQQGKSVILLEKEQTLGGLARGFKAPGWDWSLEYAYHHLFKSDTDILDLARELNHPMEFRAPITASLYRVGGKLKSLALDTPLDLLRFPLLNMFDRLRVGILFAVLKISPFISTIYEKLTLADFMRKTVGEKAYETLFGELMRKKYGKYAENILASFIWTRINKRSKSLGYPQGGFQSLIDTLVRSLTNSQVTLLSGVTITSATKVGEGYEIIYDKSDTPIHATKLISTLPTPTMGKVCGTLFNQQEKDRFSGLKHLSAMTLILETNKPILKDTYWLSLCVPEIPGLVVIQHTNYIDSVHYGGKHLLYIGNYLEPTDKLLSMSTAELMDLYTPHLKEIAQTDFVITNTFSFKAHFAQPIFDKEFVSSIPTFKTSSKNFFVANLDMTYPYDRGTNYAVALGNKVAALSQATT